MFKALAAAVPLLAAAEPETYRIDSAQTIPRVEYSNFGHPGQSQFRSTRGTITLDRAALTGAVDVEIDAASVTSGHPLIDSLMMAEDVFDTARFPLITYKSSAIGFDGDTPAWVDGSLTIKRITRQVRLEIVFFACGPHPVLGKEACAATAVARIRRSDFSAGKYAPLVSDEVTLVLPIEAIRE
ncbi:MAG: YceI family protein [Telluria sp.]